MLINNQNEQKHLENDTFYFNQIQFIQQTNQPQITSNKIEYCRPPENKIGIRNLPHML